MSLQPSPVCSLGAVGSQMSASIFFSHINPFVLVLFLHYILGLTNLNSVWLSESPFLMYLSNSLFASSTLNITALIGNPDIVELPSPVQEHSLK